ncbi:MAG: HlyD family secretion protein, partial [Gammaproteobacteria bacterium]
MKNPIKKDWQSWFPLLVLAAVMLIAALLVATRPRPEPLAPKERAWLVSVETVRLGRLAPHATLYGRLESRWSSRLTAGVAADVLEVPVIEGDRVARGDLLVKLDPRDSELRLAQREAEVQDAQARLKAEATRFETDQKSLKRERRLLQLLQAEVNRLKDLVRKQVGAQSALDNARQAVERQAVTVAAREQAIADHPARKAQLEAALQKAIAARDQARLELERCTVKAPFDGRVATVAVAPGRRTRVGDALVTVYDTRHMLLRALIPDRYLGRVRQALAAGMAVQVSGRIDGGSVTG